MRPLLDTPPSINKNPHFAPSYVSFAASESAHRQQKPGIRNPRRSYCSYRTSFLNLCGSFQNPLHSVPGECCQAPGMTDIIVMAADTGPGDLVSSVLDTEPRGPGVGIRRTHRPGAESEPGVWEFVFSGVAWTKPLERPTPSIPFSPSLHFLFPASLPSTPKLAGIIPTPKAQTTTMKLQSPAVPSPPLPSHSSFILQRVSLTQGLCICCSLS